MRFVLLGLLGLPLAEIVVFALVADRVGWLWAVGLTLAAMAAGALILSRLGRTAVAELRRGMADQRISRVEFSSAMFLRAAGAVLLIVPGFLSDVVGIAMVLRSFLVRPAPAAQQRPAQPGVVELEADEWREESATGTRPTGESPWSRGL
jgi:UPF0716 protein FxsA